MPPNLLLCQKARMITFARFTKTEVGLPTQKVKDGLFDFGAF
jgi:hypothetical protein